MKPNKPNAQEKRSTLETLRTLWVPMAVGAVLLVMLAIVANLVWKDYSTALMESQTRQMELVVQSLADSIEFSLEEYLDRLDSAVAKVEANPDDKPTLAPSDTLRDLWLEDNDGSIVYRCYGITALSDVLITRSEGVSYWQYHRGDTHYLVLKKAVGKQSVCLVVDSTTLYKQLVSDIRVGTNGYVMIKNANDMVVMHPEPAQWGIQVVDGRQKLYAYKELDLTSLSELLKAQRTQDSGIRDYYSYWWTDPKLPRVHKISAFRHLEVRSSFWIVSAVVDYDDLYQPVRDSFLKMALMFSAVAGQLFEDGAHVQRRCGGSGDGYRDDIPSAVEEPAQRDQDQRPAGGQRGAGRAAEEPGVSGARPAAPAHGHPDGRHRPRVQQLPHPHHGLCRPHYGRRRPRE